MTTEERLENLEQELAQTKAQAARANRRNRWLVAGLVLCLAVCAVFWTFDRNKPGRYAMSVMPGESPEVVYVLDTKTSQLWLRTGEEHIYLGTNDSPKCEEIEQKKATSKP
jgi:ferric-dicitrate binding protein FerR (iron transport regulator)